MLDLNLIRTDGLTQSRAKLNEDVVAEYAELYRAGVQFPPVIVFFDGKDRWLADGFHRFFAAKSAGLTSIYENITPGTLRDAKFYSWQANQEHGQRRTNEDKRSIVLAVLQDEEASQWSDNKIAKEFGFSPNFVGTVRKSLSSEDSEKPTERTYTTKHGNTATMQTANIGKLRPAPPQVDEPVAPVARDEDDYTELDAAQDQISELQSMLVVANLGDASDEDKLQASNLIADLQAEIKTLSATLKAVELSRDRLMEENTQLKRQCSYNMDELKKLRAK